MDDGLEKLLVKLNSIVEIKRRQLEVLCREYGILLKPWPNQDENVKHKTTEKDRKDLTKDKTKGQHPVISAEEQTEVDLVDNVLVRAQKARDLKKKFETKQNKEKDTSSDEGHLLKELKLDQKHENQSENNSIPETTIRSEIRNLLLQEKIKSSENLSYDSVKNNKKNKPTSHSKDALKDDTHTVSSSDSCVKKDSHVDDSHINSASYTRSASHGRSTSHTRATAHTGTLSEPRSASHTRSTSHSDKAPQKSNSARSSSRGRSHATTHVINSSASNVKDVHAPFKAPKVPRPSSSRGKSYSAHVSAPFKTDPSLRVPRMSTNKAAMVTKKGPFTGRPDSRERNMKSKLANTQSDVRTSHTTDNQSSKHQPSDEKHPDSRSERSCVDNVPDLIKDTTSLPSHVDTSKAMEGCSNGSDVSERLVRGMNDLKVAETEAAASLPDEKLFNLQQNGAKLPIPGKLRRQIAANQKLREKIAAQRVTKKVESKDARRDFLQRLEDQFDPDEDLVTQSRVLSCHRAHTRLLQLLDELQIDNITELSPVSEVLTAKLKMEYILACCNTLQEEMDMLNKADFCVDLNKGSPPLFPHKEGSVSQWLPDDVIGDVEIYPEAVFSYKNRSELQAYKHHIFELQYQRLQFVVMETVKKELLSVLQSTEKNSRSYVQVYRAIFAFLTSNDGHHLPGIVRDS